MIKQDEWDAWKDDPVTQTVMNWLAAKQKELATRWSEGGFTGPSWDQTMIQNVAATGACSAFKEVRELTFDQLIGDMEDE